MYWVRNFFRTFCKPRSCESNILCDDVHGCTNASEGRGRELSLHKFMECPGVKVFRMLRCFPLHGWEEFNFVIILSGVRSSSHWMSSQGADITARCKGILLKI